MFEEAETFNYGITLLGVKGKKQPTRKAQRKLQRLEKKKRRAIYQSRKAIPTEAVETDSKTKVREECL